MRVPSGRKTGKVSFGRARMSSSAAASRLKSKEKIQVCNERQIVRGLGDGPLVLAKRVFWRFSLTRGA